MKQLEMHVKELLIGCPPIKIVEEEELENVGEIIDINREISYGQIEVSEEGKLTSLLIDIEAIINNNDVSLDEYEALSVEDLKEMGQDFADEFGQKNLKLTTFNEWGNDTFLLIFEAIDVKFDLPLPNSGVTLEMNKQGFILSATLNQAYYQLKYPKIEVTAQQAMDIYANRVLVDMGAMQEDVNIRLMYNPMYQNEAVTVDGQLFKLSDFSDEEQLELQKIAPVTTVFTEQELLGIKEDYIVEVSEDHLITYTNNEDAEQQLKINLSDPSEIVIESNLPFTEEHEFTIEELKERAIAFLDMKVGNVTSKYLLEDILDEEELEDEEDDELTEEEIEMLKILSAQAEEDEEDEDEEDEDSSFEPFITFSFYRRLNGIPFTEFNAHIDMGIYSGAVKDSVIPLVKQQFVSSTVVMPGITFEQANEIYKDSIKMELARVPHEEEFIVYELCYVVKEKEEFKRIERIDAENGNVFYVDDLQYVEDEEELEY